MPQLVLLETRIREKDIVYTPDDVAENIVKWVKPAGICLDPCLGDGAFFKYLPAGADWCEIRQGRNFFDYKNNVDWIIGNPPYSLFEEFLQHSFEIAKDVVFLVPTNKVFQRQLIMDMINQWGGIKGLAVYGSGSLIGFPFGFSVGAYHFSKNYKGFCDLRIGRFCI